MSYMAIIFVLVFVGMPTWRHLEQKTAEPLAKYKHK